MGIEGDDQVSRIEVDETKEEYPNRKAKITYSRKQILALSELEICFKLPKGFDASILSEFEEAANSLPERLKTSRGFSTQSYRRVESDSFPPAKGDSSNLSRENGGRWINRFSVLNDKSSNTHLGLESDIEKHSGNPSRRTWQNPEHDGLLGSGSIPKQSGFTNASVTEEQESCQYQLSKANEPYQPPRPCKGAPHSRRDTDMINEETFGSSENSNRDRAEEEIRRASFEQFRKEKKAIHETQKPFPDKHKENVDPDTTALDDKKLWVENMKLEDMTPNILQGESTKCSFAAQTLASRPLAPPGFTGITREKKIHNGGVLEKVVQIESIVTRNGISNSLMDEKLLPHVDLGEKKYEIKTVHTPLKDISEKFVTGIASSECSTSILEKLCHNASVVDSRNSDFSKPGDANADTGSSIPFQSSKFLDCHPQEEKRPENGLLSGKPEELFSLLVDCGKDGFQVSRVSDQKISILPLRSSDLTRKSGTATSSTLPILESPYQSERAGASYGVFTCEDLEQSILTEFSGNSSRLDQSFESRDLNAKAKRPEVDNHASQHLLSLLQKQTSDDDFVQDLINEAAKIRVYQSGSLDSTVEDFETVFKSETNPTLEMLLGKDFMEELQSVKAPVSRQRGSVGGIMQTTQSTRHGDGVSTLIQQRKSIKDLELCLGFNASQDKVESNHGTVSEALGIQFPDEESLTAFYDGGNTSNADLSPFSNPWVDITDEVASVNATIKMERSSVPVFDHPSNLRGPINPVEPVIQYRNWHEQPTSQFAHQQMIRGRTSLQPSDSYPSHMNIPSKVMGLENVLHPDFSQPNFPANLIHAAFPYANGVSTQFSPPAQPPMLQQMQMQGNMLHPHPLQGWPRGPPMPPYAINPMYGYVPEPNAMQNLPFHHQQNYSAVEMPIQGRAVGVGSNNGWNEWRANAGHIRPVAGAGHAHGINMGVRYR